MTETVYERPVPAAAAPPDAGVAGAGGGPVAGAMLLGTR
jgi:hypothetical protein